MPTDDTDDLPSSPHTKTVMFAGVFEAGDRRTSQLSIEIAYSQTNSHPPTGLIRGTYAEYRALEEFFMARKGNSCTLRSTSKERESITCTNVRIHRLSHGYFPKDEMSTIQQMLGRFSVERVDIRNELRPSEEERKRYATFMLTGPSGVWLSYSSRTLSYTGEISVKPADAELPLDSTRDQIFTAPHFVYADSPRAKGTPRETRQAELFSLRVDDAFEIERDRTAFVADSEALTDKLCLLVSFLSKTYISWFASTYMDGNEIVQSYRNVRTTDSEAPDFDELVLDPSEIRLFLNRALSGYETCTASGFDLRIPMLYYIWAQSSRFVEDRFTTLFFALEKLLSSLDERYPESDLLTASELSKLWKVITPALEGFGKTPQQIDLVRAKRRELQRTPLKHRIERHLSALELDVTDIGGIAGILQLLSVRNLLTHDKGEVPIATVIYEIHRLETIVERMLLKLLSWDGTTRTPTYNNRPILGADT